MFCATLCLAKYCDHKRLDKVHIVHLCKFLVLFVEQKISSEVLDGLDGLSRSCEKSRHIFNGDYFVPSLNGNDFQIFQLCLYGGLQKRKSSKKFFSICSGTKCFFANCGTKLF